MEVLWDVAITKNGERIWIDDDCKETVFCPECKSEMIPVRGEIVQHHYRHKADSACSGESAKHWSKKYEIADALSHFGKVEVEGKIGRWFADVLYEDKWAFEVVYSNPPEPEKMNDLRDGLIIFNFNFQSFVINFIRQNDITLYVRLFSKPDVYTLPCFAILCLALALLWTSPMLSLALSISSILCMLYDDSELAAPLYDRDQEDVVIVVLIVVLQMPVAFLFNPRSISHHHLYKFFSGQSQYGSRDIIDTSFGDERSF